MSTLEVAFPAVAGVYPPPPPAGWLTNPGDALLAVAGAALDGAGLHDKFPRRSVVHGTPKPTAGKGPNGQLYVHLETLHMGRAGEEQFRFPQGSLGTQSQRNGVWKVVMWGAYTMPYKDVRPATPAEMAFGADFMLAALGAVWSALQALAHGAPGSSAWYPAGLLDTNRRAQEILVGRATPLGPLGALAGYDIPVSIQV